MVNISRETRDIYFAKCSKCGKRAFESFNESSVIERMTEEGWTEKNGKILCDTCAKESEKSHLVLYHGSDLDGVFSAALIVKFYGENNVRCIPVNYGMEFPYEQIDDDTKIVWVVDFSFDDKMNEIAQKLQLDYHITLKWIDHHESAIKKNPNANYINGARSIGIGACELVYRYLHGDEAISLIKYLSAYDVWDKDRFSWHLIMDIQYGVRARVGLDVSKAVSLLLKTMNSTFIRDLGTEGRAILDWTDQVNEGYVRCSAFEGRICGVKAVFMNTNVFNSNVFKSYQGEYEVMVPFRYEKNGLVRFSIYAGNNDKVSCAEMAERFGGGGHKGAAGFQLDMEKGKDLQLFIGLLKTSELNPE